MKDLQTYQKIQNDDSDRAHPRFAAAAIPSTFFAFTRTSPTPRVSSVRAEMSAHHAENDRRGTGGGGNRLVAWSSDVDHAAVAALAQGVGDRYRRDHPDQARSLRTHGPASPIVRVRCRTHVCEHVQWLFDHVLARCSQSSVPSRPVAQFGTVAGALRRRYAPPASSRFAPSAKPHGAATMTSRARDHLLTASPMSNKPAHTASATATPESEARRSRISPNSTDVQDTVRRSVDYLPPQYAKARSQARNGHMTIEEFLSNRSARRPVAADTGSHADYESGSDSYDSDHVRAWLLCVLWDGRRADTPIMSITRPDRTTAVASLTLKKSGGSENKSAPWRSSCSSSCRRSAPTGIYLRGKWRS